MAQSPSDPSGKKPYLRDRRAPRGKPGSVRWMKGLLGRPLAVERRGLQLHLTLVERRRPPEVIEAEALQQLRTELRARLLGHQMNHAAVVMRHLGVVHDVLGREGWAGVGELNSQVLGRALVQAQMLATEEASPQLAHLIERLQLLKVAATVREDRDGTRPADAANPMEPDTTRLSSLPPAPAVDLETLEVSEGSAEDFQDMERGWVDTVRQADPAAEPTTALDGQA